MEMCNVGPGKLFQRTASYKMIQLSVFVNGLLVIHWHSGEVSFYSFSCGRH